MVRGALAQAIPSQKSNLRVVEFGCGTGLGYELLLQTGADVEYTGIDVSTAMLDIFKSKVTADVSLINAPLESVGSEAFADMDLVMAIFTSASYVDLNLEDLLARTAGWLRPRGRLYLSFLNRTSMRHFPRWGLRDQIEYSSRGLNSGTVPARRYTKAELLQNCRRLGLVGAVQSLGPFSGVLELAILQRLNSALKSTSRFTHTIELSAFRAG
ncbi:class I SAM-dependent methyltransferase [Nocardia fluminea]|uniref:class I SAM-dependent methyltransferase n=1 Tax=Nocardia fluminea TaxID=134984 RepID=UPI0036660F3F